MSATALACHLHFYSSKKCGNYPSTLRGHDRGEGRQRVRQAHALQLLQKFGIHRSGPALLLAAIDVGHALPQPLPGSFSLMALDRVILADIDVLATRNFALQNEHNGYIFQ